MLPLPLRREDAVAKRTYKTRQETEAKKPVTATIVLTLLFISGARAGGVPGWRLGGTDCGTRQGGARSALGLV